MTLTRVAHKRKVRASNAEARRTGRTFPNHQARCALLIPLRFEFANEFQPPQSQREAARRWASGAICCQTPAARPHFDPSTDAQSRRERDQFAAQSPDPQSGRGQ